MGKRAGDRVGGDAAAPRLPTAGGRRGQDARPPGQRVRARSRLRPPWQRAPRPAEPAAPGRAGQVARAVLPFLVMAVLAAVDLLSSPQYFFVPLMALGPALAAVSLSPMLTVLTGAVGVALSVLMAAQTGLEGTSRGLIAYATIAGVTGAGLLASMGRRRREQEFANVRAVADIAQRVLLREVPAAAGRMRMVALYVSAAPSARVGGDLYDVVATGDAVRLVVGDVQGKGLAAVHTAAVALAAFRETAYDAPGLGEIARRIELSLQRQTGSEEFVTAILAQFRVDGTAIELLNCGHPPPLLVRGETACFAAPPVDSLPLGLAALAATRRQTHVVPFGPGDQVLFYTDGVSEARDKAGVFYPLDRRGGAMLAHANPEQALERLRADVLRHSGGVLLDDAAMLLIRHG